MGCGIVARYGHIPAIQACEELELFAIFDPNRASLDSAQAQFGVPHVFDDEYAFFASGIEAVTITSPASYHLSNVLQAARHGLPAICEKPLAMDTSEVEQMIAAMGETGATLYSAYCYRFSEVALKIRELLAEKAIGEARSLRLIYNWNCHGKFRTNADGERVIQTRRAESLLGGGSMFDFGDPSDRPRAVLAEFASGEVHRARCMGG